MLIVALVLAVIGLAALVTAVVTSNEVIAWVCIAASVIGVLLLIVDAVRERSAKGEADTGRDSDTDTQAEPEPYEDYPEDEPADDTETTVVEQAESDEVSGEDRSR
jgi:hypothetical protein